MKKEGFTLIELLLVIVIVATISAGATIIFGQVNQTTAEEELKNTYISIQRAAKMYVDLNDTWTKSFNERGFITVSLSALQSTNYTDNELKNPVTKDPMPGNLLIKICVATENHNGIAENHVDSCILYNNQCKADSDGNEKTPDNLVECCANCS